MGNPSVEYLVMAQYRGSGPMQAGPMTMAPEPSPGGEVQAAELISDELKIPKVDSFTEGKPSHDKCSPPAVAASANDGTIGTSRGKAHCKSPFLACQLSVFFAWTR
jgi:hypothetical protein